MSRNFKNSEDNTVSTLQSTIDVGLSTGVTGDQCKRGVSAFFDAEVTPFNSFDSSIIFSKQADSDSCSTIEFRIVVDCQVKRHAITIKCSRWTASFSEKDETARWILRGRMKNSGVGLHGSSFIFRYVQRYHSVDWLSILQGIRVKHLLDSITQLKNLLSEILNPSHSRRLELYFTHYTHSIISGKIGRLVRSDRRQFDKCKTLHGHGFFEVFMSSR